MRRRFFVEHFDAGSCVLRGQGAEHLSRVLRAEPGQLYELSDGTTVWLGRVERAGRDAVHFSLVEQLAARVARLRTRVLLSIVKMDRFEWCLEKATELGVAEIVPLAAERTDKVLVQAAAKRAPRWQKILLESAQQARRLRPPVLHPVGRPRPAFRDWQAKTGLSLLLSEQAEAPALRSILQGKVANEVTVAFGPAGGWTQEEFTLAANAGYLEASLGEHILRTETAVLASLANLNYALGE
jgi:16S rRNA (uracil1498-N3)-methyltransferase